MKIKEFKAVVEDITGITIVFHILKNQEAKKWYEKTFMKISEDEDIIENAIYGVEIEGIISYEFKAGKIDNLLKTFITQYVNKHLLNTPFIENGEIKYHTRDSAMRSLKDIRARHAWYITYSTNYGIGMWNLFVSTETKNTVKNKIETLLNAENIEFENEYSDARWVFRYLLKGNHLDHNLLIDKLKK